MDIVSFSFLLFALLAILLLRCIRSLTLRPALVFLLNAIFLASFLHQPVDALPVLSMLALGYGALLIVERRPSRAALGIMITAIVLLFIWLKRYTLIMPLLPAHTTPLMVVGISYILFRIVHLVVDVGQKVRPAPLLLAYINYCLFFPTFLSGPIARYEHFDEEMRRPLTPLTIEQLHYALSRIALGLMMLVVFSVYASMVVTWIKATHSLATPDHTAWFKTAQLFSLTSFAVFIKLYMNFCGSMHIIIGTAALAGFVLPENFNKPYLAKNFLDFWARWHITLSEWIKYYLFNPLLRVLSLRFPSPRATTAIGAFAFFVAFFVIGIWHGTTAAFAIFGVMLGLAATTNKLWQQFLTRTLGKKRYKHLTQRDWYFQLSRGMTLSYIAIALMCLWMEPGYIAANGAAWLIGIMILSWILMTLVLAAAGSVCDRVLPHFGTWRMPRSDTGRMVVMALIVWFVFNHLGGYASGTPELVYKGF